MEGGTPWQQGDLAGVLDGEHSGFHQVHHVESQLQDQGTVPELNPSQFLNLNIAYSHLFLY